VSVDHGVANPESMAPVPPHARVRLTARSMAKLFETVDRGPDGRPQRPI
jgi:hypothetical protein